MTSASQARDPARQQRRHPGVPLVRARPPVPDGLQQPGRCRRDRPPRLQRRGAAVERRRQHLQPRHRRRDPVVPDDGRASATGSHGLGDSRAFTSLLLQPDRLPAVVHAVPGRVRQGAVSRPPDAARAASSRRLHRGSSTRACGPPATSCCAT